MKILVVGLGSMGRRRLRNLAHLGGHDIAGTEIVEARRAEVARDAGIPSFATLEEGLEWQPEAIVISTPPDRHAGPALAAAERGIPFFIEASVVLDGVDELISIVRRNDVVACPSCTMRFHPGVRKLGERIEAGAIGKPLAFTHHVGQYLPDWHPWEDYRTFYVAKRETGAAREIVPFELNWLTGLFGDLTHISGLVSKLSSLDADIDDAYAMTVRHASGVEGTLMVEAISRPAIRSARIIGEKGTLVWDWNAREVREWSAAVGEWTSYPDPPSVQGPGGDWVAENMYIDEMEGFLRAVREGSDAWPLSLEQDRALLQALVDVESQRP